MHKEWLEFAAMDLDSAQFLLGMRPVPVEIICYHCEQGQRQYQRNRRYGHWDLCDRPQRSLHRDKPRKRHLYLPGD